MGGEGGMSVTIFCQKFFDSEYRKTSYGTFLCFTKFLLSKKFMDKRWVGGKEYHGFLSKIFCLTVPKNFVGNHSVFHYFQVSKNLMPMRGISRFSKEILLSHSTEKLRRGTFLCFTMFLVSEKLIYKRGRSEDLSRYSVNFFLSHSTEKFHRETFLLYTKFSVSKCIMDKRWEVKEGGVSRYSVKSFLSQSTEKLRTEPFCASLIQVLIILCL